MVVAPNPGEDVEQESAIEAVVVVIGIGPPGAVEQNWINVNLCGHSFAP